MIVTPPDKNWTYLPTHKFRLQWKRLFNQLITEYPEMYECSAACAATIYLVDEFSMESMSDEELRDGAIILYEVWFFAMAECSHCKKIYENKAVVWVRSSLTCDQIRYLPPSITFALMASLSNNGCSNPSLRIKVNSASGLSSIRRMVFSSARPSAS